jgi:NADH:ubiquinone oxidoreductase subunit F (NADH-binding)
MHGLPALSDLLMAMAYGQAPEGSRQRLDRWTRQIAGRGACHLPDGAVRFLRSGLEVFAEEIAEHTRRGPCHACRRPTTLRFARAGAPPARAAA